MPVPASTTLNCPKTVQKLTLERLPNKKMKLSYGQGSGNLELIEDYQLFRYLASLVCHYRNCNKEKHANVNWLFDDLDEYKNFNAIVRHDGVLVIRKRATLIIRLDDKEVDSLLDMCGALLAPKEGSSKKEFEWKMLQSTDLPIVEVWQWTARHKVTETDFLQL